MKFFALFLIISSCLILALNSYASDRNRPFEVGEACFNVATGHKYIKNPDTTYREFSKKGVLLRDSVPNDLPLITTNKYIRETSMSYYLLYRRNNNGQKESLLLTLNHAHPEGWLLKKP